MNELFSNLLMAVITAVIPVLTAFIVNFLRKATHNTTAVTESAEYVQIAHEVTHAVSDAVTATNQTYVDALKHRGEFNSEAQKKAVHKALTACFAALSPATIHAIATMYGDITVYLIMKIEAEVRNQKLSVSTYKVQQASGQIF